jgi:hypothetical protein
MFHDSHEVDHQIATALSGISAEQLETARRAFEQRGRRA